MLVEESRWLIEENRRLAEENKQLKARLDEALNAIAFQAEEIRRLKDEIARLKGQKSRPKIPPSALEGAQSMDKQSDKNRVSRGKHPRRKKTHIEIHARIRIKPETIPEGAVFKGCKRVAVQDIVFQPHNTIYELERWRLPDGTYLAGQMPRDIQGHYGPRLIGYILHQYHGCRVTEALLLDQLRDIGVLISAGQLNNILTQGKEAFHQEKDELLLAGIASTRQIKVDDTGARHGGHNGYSTIIGNEYFTYVVSTESKSRINFLEVLHGGEPCYLVNSDAVDYVETMSPTSWFCGYFLLRAQDQPMNWEEFGQFLRDMNLVSEGDKRLVTEASLFAGLVAKGIPKTLGVHGDDAGQFNVFVRSLCWVHEERHFRKLIPVDEEAHQAIGDVRRRFWELYRGLREYKCAPSGSQKLALEQAFDDLFLKTTTMSPTLNRQLRRTYEKKERLLRVLERPETPLHNNGTETDAREMVIKRKVSGGTRSEEGKRCRDTFVSLKKTCIKLGVNFWRYLEDRVEKRFAIPRLAQQVLICSASQRTEPVVSQCPWG